MKTEIPGEGVLGLAIQCICNLLKPIDHERAIELVLNSSKELVKHINENKDFFPRLGLPKTIFIGLSKMPGTPGSLQYIVGASSLKFPKYFPSIIDDTHYHKRKELID